MLQKVADESLLSRETGSPIYLEFKWNNNKIPQQRTNNERIMNDILSYPIDKYYPLELFEIEAANDSIINDSDIWESFFARSVQGSIQLLQKIPLIYPDGPSWKEKNLNFLQKWWQRIPSEIV